MHNYFKPMSLKTVCFCGLFFSFAFFQDLSPSKILDGFVSVGINDSGLPSTNLYESRKREHENLKEFYADFIKERDGVFVSLAQDRQQEANNKKTVEADLFEEAKEISLELIDESIDVIREIYNVYESFKAVIDDHLTFINHNQDLHSDNFATARMLRAYTLSDLYKLEKDVDKIANDLASTERKKSVVERKKTEEEFALDLLKKEIDKPVTSIGSEVKKGADSARVLLKRKLDLLNYKVRLSDLRIKHYLKHLDFIDREWTYLKSRQKYQLEPALVQARDLLVVSEKNLSDLQFAYDAEKKALSTEKEASLKRILDNKDKRNFVYREMDKNKKIIEKAKSVTADSHSAEALVLLVRDLSLKLRHSAIEKDIDLFEVGIDARLYGIGIADERQALEEINFNLRRSSLRFLLGKEKEASVYDDLKVIKEVALPALDRSINELHTRKGVADSFAKEVATTKRAQLKAMKDDLRENKAVAFKNYKSFYQEAMVSLGEAEGFLNYADKTNSDYRLLIENLILKKKSFRNRYDVLRKNIQDRMGQKNLWARSPSAISSEDLLVAISDAETFYIKFFWDAKEKLNPFFLVSIVKQGSKEEFLGIFLLMFIFLLLFSVLKRGVKRLHDYAQRNLLLTGGKTDVRFPSLAASFLDSLYAKFFYVFLWLFTHLLIVFKAKVFGLDFAQLDPFYVAFFYLISIPILLFLTNRFITNFRELNQRASYFFFSEDGSLKNVILLYCILLSACLIVPFWFALTRYSLYFRASVLRSVLIAACSLIVEVGVLFFWDKEDFVALIPSGDGIFGMIKRKVNTFYHPIFTFVMGILIIFNPYVGYSNLAWFLLFMVPITVLVLYVTYLAYYYFRQYLYERFFSKGDEGEAVGKFEYARASYGFLVMTSFFVVCFSVFFLLTRFWGINYYPADLWRALSEEWVFDLGEKEKFGIVQVLSFASFLICGYIASALASRFALNKLFDLFGLDSGLQNTVSKMFHYFVIVIAVVLGLVAIKFTEILKYSLVGLAGAMVLGVKDQIADIFAGILILLERQIEIGHFVQLENIQGTVHKISVRSTTVRTARNFFISIPNRKLISNLVINWGAGRVAVGFEVKVVTDYGFDSEWICEVLKEVVYDHPLVLRVPSATVRLESFEDSGMEFFLRAFIGARKVREQWAIASKIRIEILKVFKNKGITIPYPNTVVHFADKEHTPVLDDKSSSISIKFNKQPE